MVASFDKAGAPPKGPIMQAHVDPYYATLERAIEDAAKHGVGSGFAGECIYLVAVTTTGRGLGRRLVGETQELLGIESRLEDAAKGLLVPGAPDNTLLVETLLYPRDRRSLLLGMAPPFWWDLRTRSLRRVYLGQVLVLTIGNPARLHSHYRRLGFDLEYREDESGPVLVRAIGERRLELTGTGYYWRAVSEHLYSAQAIADKLEEVVGHAASSEATRIDIRFRHRHWPSGSRRRKG